MFIRMTMGCNVLAFLFVAVPIGSSLQAQSIDQLFRQFNSEFDAADYTLAERTARRMVQAAASDNSWMASSLLCLGQALNSQRRFAEAVPVLERAQQYPLRATNTNRGWIPNSLGNSYRNLERFDEAERSYRRALDEFTTMHGANSRTVASVRFSIGWLYHARGQFDKAAEEHQAVLRIQRPLLGDDSSNVASTMAGLGVALSDGGKLIEGQKHLEQALAIKKRADGPEVPDVAVILSNLAWNSSKQGNHEEAEKQSLESLAIREKLFGHNSQIVADGLEDHAKFLEKAGKSDDARRTADEAQQIEAAIAKGGVSRDNPFRVGQKIQVNVAQASVMDGGAAIGSLTKGMELKVTNINGRWCGVRVMIGGKERTGWLDSNLATTAAAAAEAAKPLDLAKVIDSQAGRFKIKMPKDPIPGKITLQGFTQHTLKLELGQGNFLAAYVDVPAGFMLTFDAAAQAYARDRKGTVENEKQLALRGEFPGRDVMIKLPSGDYSRMQLYVVGGRHYQLIIEGTKEFVTSKLADDFFASFDPS
jgi:tetratricopeptide (TPR) repeat protein